MDHRVVSHERVVARRSAESWTFLTEAVRDLRTTGAVVPSGTALGHLLTDPVGASSAGRPLTVLEAGAGTGSVTRLLISRLPAGSHLDVVEANPRFAARLRHLVRARPRPGGRSAQIRVHQGYVERLRTDRRYDVIVSGLPFANFTPEQVETVMAGYLELLRPGGTLTYFAYRGTRPVRDLLASPAEARRHRAVASVLAAYHRRYAVGCRTAWRNLPPARVWQLRRPTTPAAEPHPVLVEPAALGAGG